jgi:hypothetical protein
VFVEVASKSEEAGFEKDVYKKLYKIYAKQKKTYEYKHRIIQTPLVIIHGFKEGGASMASR